MQKALKLEFFNSKGVLVPEMSVFPASPSHIQSAIVFLGDSNSFKVSVIDYDPKSQSNL